VFLRNKLGCFALLQLLRVRKKYILSESSG
jgi:hypothetical protein